MPTAHEYRTAATRLRQIAQDVDEHAFMLGACPVGDVVAGPIAGHVAAAIDSVNAEINRASDGLAELVVLCERRADVCDDFADTERAWYEADNLGGVPPPYPSPPFPWVEL